MEEFAQQYEVLRSLSKDLEFYKRKSKGDVVDHLIDALKTLDNAYGLINVQSDTILRSTNELLKQCEATRSACVADLKKPSTVLSYASMAKSDHTIILKRVGGSETTSKPDIKSKMTTALKDVRVNNAHFHDNGTMIVKVPDQQCYNAAVEKLSNEFSNFTIEAVKKITPKLTVTNIPLHVTDDSFVSEICDKDPLIKSYIDDSDELTVINSWNIKNRSDKIVARKIAIKCSPRIRNYIMKRCDGYVYINLVRCKTYDRFFVPQCYHCQRYNHFSKDCPNKDNNPVCGKCSRQHDTRNCQSNELKCINCVRYSENDASHAAFSSVCPSLDKARKLLMARTNYDESKN